MSTLLTQVEARLNSRPLVPLPNDNDGIEASTPGHFLIGKTLQLSLTIHFSYDKSISHSDVGDSTKPYSFTFGRDGILSTSPTLGDSQSGITPLGILKWATSSFFVMILHYPLNGLWLG